MKMMGLMGLAAAFMFMSASDSYAQAKKPASGAPPRFDIQKDAPNIEAGKVAVLVNAKEYERVMYGKELNEINKRIKEITPKEGAQASEEVKEELTQLKAKLDEIAAKAAAEVGGRDEDVNKLLDEYRKNPSNFRVLQQIKKVATDNINFVIQFEDQVLVGLKGNVDRQRAAFTKNKDKWDVSRRDKALAGIEKAGAEYTNRSTKRNLIYDGRYRFVNAVVEGAKKPSVAQK